MGGREKLDEDGDGEEEDVVPNLSEDEVSFLVLQCHSERKTKDLVKLNGPCS